MSNAQNTNLRSILYGNQAGQGTDSSRTPHCLYDHIVQLLSTIDTMKSTDSSFENFEQLSNFLKMNKFVHKQPSSDTDILNKKASDNHGVKAHSQKCRDFISSKKSTKNTFVQPITQDNLDWNSAGFGFSEEHAYYLERSIQKLVTKHPEISEIKYWGKIRGLNKDYEIIYGKQSSYKKDVCNENWESQGEGINQITFWVANSIMEEWIELPIIGPEHINVARVVKYQFTGNLSSPIKTLVPFQGKEKHFLKAQLVRITHNCQIVPGGLYAPDDENGKFRTLLFHF